MVSIQSTVNTGHEDLIHDAQTDYYGNRLATCSSDRSVKIFDVKDGTQAHVADLKGHEGPVWQVAWAHPRYGSILASCSYDRKIILWREDEPGVWSKLEEFTHHDSSVNSICWAPQDLGLVLIAGSSDGNISIMTYTGGTGKSGQLWEIEKITNAHMIGCNTVSWCPSAKQRRFVSGGCDNAIKIWSYDGSQRQWVEEDSLEGHTDWVRDVAWAPSLGKKQNVIASCSQDCHVLIWDKDSSTNSWNHKVLATFNDVVWHVSWSVSGNMLAVSGGDNKVSLWKETADGQWMCVSDETKNPSLPAA